MEVDAGRPLSTDELKTMHGQPVWCETLKCYGIVTVEQAGQWVGVPFILGVIDGITAWCNPKPHQKGAPFSASH